MTSGKAYGKWGSRWCEKLVYTCSPEADIMIAVERGGPMALDQTKWRMLSHAGDLVLGVLIDGAIHGSEWQGKSLCLTP